MRRLLATASLVSIAVSVVGAFPQTPAFEVISVKASPAGTRLYMRREWTPGRFSGRGLPLVNIIGQAFPSTVRIDGGPDWVSSPQTLWDIEATFHAERDTTADEKRVMLQGLLASQFKLRLRTEVRETMVYVVTRVRPGAVGPSLLKSTSPCTSSRRTVRVDSPPTDDRRPPCVFTYDPPRDLLLAGDVSFSRFLRNLEPELGRPLVDRTGLSGNFDIVLRYAQEGLSTSPTVDAAPSLVAAFREQLGLKLEATRAPLEYSVIDRVEKPGAN